MGPDVYEGAYYYQYVKLNFRDIQTGGKLDASGDIVVGNIPSGAFCDLAYVVLHTALAGASDITCNVGYGSTPNELIAALDLDGLTKAAANTGAAFTGTDSDSDTTVNVKNVDINNSANARVVKARFAGTVASLTAGEWTVVIRVFDPGKLAKK